MWGRLHSLLGSRYRPIAMLVLGSMLAGISESGVLALLAQVATALVAGASHAHIELGPIDTTQPVSTLLVVGFGLAVVRLGLQVMISIVPARIAGDVQMELRTGLFDSFSRSSWDVQSKDRDGHLQEVLTSQVTQATSGVLEAAAMVAAGVTFLVLVAAAFALSVSAALIVMTAATGLFLLLQPLSRFGNRRARELSGASLRYAGGVNEAVRVAEETRVFGVEAAQRKRIGDLIRTARDLFVHIQGVSRLVRGIYQSLIYVLIMLALAALYWSGAGQIASLGAVVLLLIRAGTYGQQTQAAYQSVRQALPFLERVEEAQVRYGASPTPAGSRPLPAVRSLAFEHVDFAYEPDRPVLSDVDFEIAREEAIGMVGPSGVGKSTIVQILLGLREPTSGRYLINGVPASEFTRDEWHARIAYVPQEPRLLHASVADNIRFLRDVDDEAVERAARLAGIHDLIARWPAGYQTIVGPRADAVSGGQQQRICLARALAGRPQVLVLDEPTSALDPHSERLIQDSLLALKHELTLFVVAHRLSTLDICERVMVILDGKIEAFGTLDRLRLDSAYYRSAAAVAAEASGTGT